jgi:hypothetical protein
MAKMDPGFQVNPRCFSLFFQKFTASDTSFAADILGFRRFGRKNNREKPAVLSLFWRKIKSEILQI